MASIACCGRQTIFSHLLRQVPPPTPQATKTLVLAHREELLNQAAQRIALINPDLVRGARVGLEGSAGRRRSLKQSPVRADLPGWAWQVVDIDQGDRRASPLADVLVASVPTLGRAVSNRLDLYDPARFKCIIVDEVRLRPDLQRDPVAALGSTRIVGSTGRPQAHHVSATTYLRTLDHFGARRPVRGGRPPSSVRHRASLT